MSESIRVRAFAKINLGLRVLGARPDGYHEIRTVFQTIGLADRLEIELRRGKKRIELASNDRALPRDRRNLVWKAADAWRRARRFKGSIRIWLEKRIPVGAGLGGGSSDAAATLLALERMTGDRIPDSERLQMAAELGSDVPFFLFGGRAMAAGRGEIIYPLRDSPSRRCLVVFPGFSVSTAKAYSALDSQLTRRKQARKISSVGARPHLNPVRWGPAENDFESVVFAKWPELAKLKRLLIRAGAESVSLSGSGSSLYAFFLSSKQMTGAHRLIQGQAFPVRTLGRAAYRRMMFAQDRKQVTKSAVS